MKKAIVILLVFCMLLSLSACSSDAFSFKRIDSVDNFKCRVSLNSFDEERESGASNGIDDGSASTFTVLEDPVIKDAYNLISKSETTVEKIDISKDNTLYLTFYSEDDSSAKKTFYGAFAITDSGAFIAYNEPDDDSCYYYQGDANLYNEIMDIIAKCKY